MEEVITKQRHNPAAPPVKIACLACRASRIRCDGHATCSSCTAKNKTCVYGSSNRGGPRVPGRRKAEARRSLQRSDCVVVHDPIQDHEWDLFQHPYDGSYEDLMMPMISPGAGLKRLDSDVIFDSIFHVRPSQQTVDRNLLSLGQDDPSSSQHTSVRRCYGNYQAILNAYYIFIHPYFPILPPPKDPLGLDSPLEVEPENFEPSSPISLAICAILALVPHPADAQPRSPTSVSLRRRQAQLYAQSAMESIEIEAELLTSMTSPSEALGSDPQRLQREPFHAHVSIELEAILAYLILSIYEYSQRGNIAKMRNRASQAFDAATRLSLQEESDDSSDEHFLKEARRRAWWMTYVCVLQGSIISSTAPIIHVDRRSFPTPLPSIASDEEAWPAYLDAQQLILRCTQYTVSLKKALQRGSDLTHLQTRMTLLDQEIDALLASYTWTTDPSPGVDCNEEVLARSLKTQAQIKLNSARIKLHRYQAFRDMPIFTQKHCDLERAQNPPTGLGATCSCSGLLAQSVVPELDLSRASSSSSLSGRSDCSPQPFAMTDMTGALQPARVCMKAALNISFAFEALPYPNPTQTRNTSGPTFLSASSLTFAPRTMPAFACCAMQSSYALLMLCRKSQEWNSSAIIDSTYYSAIEELHSGLQRVINALQNYSLAFEALDGMRSQIQEATESMRILSMKQWV